MLYPAHARLTFAACDRPSLAAAALSVGEAALLSFRLPCRSSPRREFFFFALRFSLLYTLSSFRLSSRAPMGWSGSP
jgi:hypothetical protein